MLEKNELAHREQPDVPLEVSQAMSEHVQQFVTPIAGLQKDGAEVCGTGFYIDLFERTFLITAAHVLAHEGPGDNPYGFKAVQGREEESALAIVHTSVRLPDDGGGIADLGMVQVPRGYPSASNSVSLPMRRIALSSSLIPADTLFVQGFPASLSYYGFESLVTKGFGRLTFPLGNEESKENRSSYFYVDYSRERWIKDDKRFTDPAPDAMSGSPVWRTNWTPTYATWSPEDAEVCGIATRWDESTASLAVVRVEHMHAFFLRGLERLSTSLPADE